MGPPGEARIVIDGNRFSSTGMGAEYEGTFELDVSATPSWIDMKFDRGAGEGQHQSRHLSVHGDSWKLCLATRGTIRPTRFASPAGSGIAVETLVRGKAAAKPRRAGKVSEPAGPPTEFEGDWQMISGVMNGVAMDAAAVQWVKRITRRDRTTVTAGPQTILKVEFTFDPVDIAAAYRLSQSTRTEQGKAPGGHLSARRRCSDGLCGRSRRSPT